MRWEPGWRRSSASRRPSSASKIRSERITILSRALRPSGPGGTVRPWNRRVIGDERGGFAHHRSDRFRRATGSLSSVGFVFQRPVPGSGTQEGAYMANHLTPDEVAKESGLRPEMSFALPRGARADLSRQDRQDAVRRRAGRARSGASPSGVKAPTAHEAATGSSSRGPFCVLDAVGAAVGGRRAVGGWPSAWNRRAWFMVGVLGSCNCTERLVHLGAAARASARRARCNSDASRRRRRSSPAP